jgi:hypothetical protein
MEPCRSDDDLFEQECYKVIHTSTKGISLSLVSLEFCECQWAGTGFIMEQIRSDYEWQVLWGCGEDVQSHSEYVFHDIDGDGHNEIFTLFMDESNVWGFAHRYRIDSLGYFILQTLKLPYVVTDEIRLGGRYSVNSDHSFSLLGKTYLGLDSITVIYDNESDSIKLKEK